MKKINNHPRGSILIWTVLLGVSLTTVFLYFSERLNFNAALQRKTIEYQHAKQLIESYADYLESLTLAELEAFEGGVVNFEDIRGNLVRQRDEITRVLDANQSVDYSLMGGAMVQWNLCEGAETGRVFSVTPNKGITLGNCGSSDYDGQTEMEGATINLTSGGAPVSYKITPSEGGILYDNQWTMELEISPSPRQSISIYRTFTPAS